MQVASSALLTALLGTAVEDSQGPRAETQRQPPPAASEEGRTTPSKPITLPEIPQRRLSIRLEDNKKVVYQIVDEKTGEVVREVPPEEIRRTARRIAELQRSYEAALPRTLDIHT